MLNVYAASGCFSDYFSFNFTRQNVKLHEKCDVVCSLEVVCRNGELKLINNSTNLINNIKCHENS